MANQKTREKVAGGMLGIVILVLTMQVAPGWLPFDLGLSPATCYVLAGIAGLIAAVIGGGRYLVPSLFGYSIGSAGAVFTAGLLLSHVDSVPSGILMLVGFVGAAPGYALYRLLKMIQDANHPERAALASREPEEKENLGDILRGRTVERLPHPIRFNCPACGARNAQGTVMEITETLRETWVTCGVCGARLRSLLPLHELPRRTPAQLEAYIRDRAPPGVLALCLAGLLLFWVPVVGLALSSVGFYLARGTRGNARAAGLWGTGLGAATTLLVALVFLTDGLDAPGGGHAPAAPAGVAVPQAPPAAVAPNVMAPPPVVAGAAPPLAAGAAPVPEVAKVPAEAIWPPAGQKPGMGPDPLPAPKNEPAKPAVDHHEPQTREPLEQSVTNLLGGNLFEKRQAMADLLAADPESVSKPLRSKIAKALKQVAFDEMGMPQEREQAMAGLVKWGGKFSVPVLVELLGTSNPFVRRACYTELGKLRDPRAAEPVARALANNFVDRREAFACLEAIGPAAEEAVLASFNPGDMSAARPTIALLGQIGTAKSLKTLRALRRQTYYPIVANDVARAVAAIQRRQAAAE